MYFSRANNVSGSGLDFGGNAGTARVFSVNPGDAVKIFLASSVPVTIRAATLILQRV